MIYNQYRLLLLYLLFITLGLATIHLKPVTEEIVIIKVPVIFIVEKEQEAKPVVAPKTTPKKEVEQPVKKQATRIDNRTYLLAQIIHAEAKGEPYNGKVAVGNVIMNRVEHPSFPDTIKEVIFQKGQFSPVTDGSIHNKPTDESIQAARDVLNGKQVVGDQALYFYNPDISTSDWIFSRQTLMEIGNHRFAR